MQSEQTNPVPDPDLKIGDIVTASGAPQKMEVVRIVVMDPKHPENDHITCDFEDNGRRRGEAFERKCLSLAT